MKLSQKSLEYKVLGAIKDNRLLEKGDRVIVAVSGGADSISLLFLLLQLKSELDLGIYACHYNHRLRGEESDRDEQFVEKKCREWGIECIIGSAPASNSFKNEEEARIARYLFFENILQDRRGAKLAIGHNANDLIETFFLQLVRGSGLRGLRSIPLMRKNYLRPLLFTSRKEIELYLKEKNVNFIDDRTNFQLKYTRNFIRLKVIPLLMQVNPNLISTISDSIGMIRDDYDYIDEEANKIFNKIASRPDKGHILIDRKEWIVYHPAIRRAILRIAIENIADLDDINIKHIKEVENILICGVGKKHKILPHSLRFELRDGKIIFIR